jgi:hypothetical protein
MNAPSMLPWLVYFLAAPFIALVVCAIIERNQ